MSILSCYSLRGCCRHLIKGYQLVRYSFYKGAYEGDGKTTMTILNKDLSYGLMIDAITPMGFKLNVGLYILGPMIIFPRTVIGWNIESANDIHENSLTLFKVMIPRPDIIILGLDCDYPLNAPFIVDFKKILKNLKIQSEILPVDKACTTFNFLNAEKRFVVGALLPPRKLDKVDSLRLQEVAIRKALSEPLLKKDD